MSAPASGFRTPTEVRDWQPSSATGCEGPPRRSVSIFSISLVLVAAAAALVTLSSCLCQPHATIECTCETIDLDAQRQRTPSSRTHADRGAPRGWLPETPLPPMDVIAR